jgi:hypothetical protein
LRTIASASRSPERVTESAQQASPILNENTATSSTPDPASDPTVAAALFAAWSGDPAVVVAAPPGAGKTRLVVHLADQLQRRAGLRVAIAAQTRHQAVDVATRAAATGAKVGLLGSKDSARAPGLDSRVHYLAGVAHLGRWHGVAVATTARWLWVSEQTYTADICIVDFSSRPHGVFDVDCDLRSSAVAYGQRPHVRDSGGHELQGPCETVGWPPIAEN